jgi:hypothetical protein
MLRDRSLRRGQFERAVEAEFPAPRVGFLQEAQPRESIALVWSPIFDFRSPFIFVTKRGEIQQLHRPESTQGFT